MSGAHVLSRIAAPLRRRYQIERPIVLGLPPGFETPYVDPPPAAILATPEKRAAWHADVQAFGIAVLEAMLELSDTEFEAAVEELRARHSLPWDAEFRDFLAAFCSLRSETRTAMSKSTSKNVEALLALVDAEGDFAYEGHRWLKADQPTIAKKLGCAPRTVGNIIKNPAFVTHRTRLGGKNVTLIGRADAKSANPQTGKAKSANQQSPKAKSATKPAAATPAKPASSAKVDATLEQLHAREELRQIWLAHQFKFNTDRVTPKEYGLLLELVKRGITPHVFRYVLNHWKFFLTGVNALCTDPDTGKSLLTAYRPEPWLSTIVEFAEVAKEAYLIHQKETVDKLADQL